MHWSPAWLIAALSMSLASCHQGTTQTSGKVLDLVEMRDSYRTMALQSTNPLPSMESIEQRTVRSATGPVTLQVYNPGGRDLPVILLFPSIDYTAGDIVTHDHVARSLAAETPAIVILPSLPLEPEHTRKKVVNALVDVLEWIPPRIERWEGRPDCIMLVGEGAGASLALSLARQARDARETPLVKLVLLTPSFGNEGLPMASTFRGLPPTYVILGEDDPLQRQGEAMVDAMQSTGVDARSRRLAGTGALRMDWALADPDLLELILDVGAVMQRTCVSGQ